MSKTEWPTSQKLESLRSDGLVAVSDTTLRLTVSAVILVFLVTSCDYLIEVLQKLSKAEISLVEVQGMLPDFTLYILLPVILALITTILAGFFQTRFFFKPSLCAPDSRRFSGKVISKDNFIFLGRALFGFVLVSIFSGLVLWKYGRSYLGLLNANKEGIINGLIIFDNQLMFFLILSLLLLAVFSWLLKKFEFLASHRMSRAEIVRE
ncbi:MAG: EscU/YscU/HrcU family type III secretion system export apparatus switch protein [Bdellovibrionota bacterium]